MNRLRQIWDKHQVLIVFIPGLVVMHLAWDRFRKSPLLEKEPRDNSYPEPAIVTYILQQEEAKKKAKDQQ